MAQLLLVTDDIMRERLRVNVRAHRNAASLSAAAASKRVKMHLRHWQKIEAGVVNVTLLTLARVGVALGVDPTKLLNEPTARGPGESGCLNALFSGAPGVIRAAAIAKPRGAARWA
jgi:hypothetical protein